MTANKCNTEGCSRPAVNRLDMCEFCIEKEHREGVAQAMKEEEERWDRNGPKCPACGSHKYIQATYVEECRSCGHGVSYW